MLTPRQNQLLKFIAAYARAHSGVTPTYQEMADGMGVQSKSVVGGLVEGLVERGFLKRGRGDARNLEIVRTLKVPRAPADAIGAERERCAKVAENHGARDIATAIRSVADAGASPK